MMIGAFGCVAGRRRAAVALEAATAPGSPVTLMTLASMAVAVLWLGVQGLMPWR